MARLSNAKGLVWIVSTPGDVERARAISAADGLADIVRIHAIRPRKKQPGTPDVT